MIKREDNWKTKGRNMEPNGGRMAKSETIREQGNNMDAPAATVDAACVKETGGKTEVRTRRWWWWSWYSPKLNQYTAFGVDCQYLTALEKLIARAAVQEIPGPLRNGKVVYSFH
jgi:hypothetical protein